MKLGPQKIVTVVLIAVILMLSLVRFDNEDNKTAPITPSEEGPKDWFSYAGAVSGLNFLIKYPPGFTALGAYKYQSLGSGKDIPGVAFGINPGFRAETNLSDDSKVSVEVLPLTKNTACSANLFVADVTHAQPASSEMVGGRTYSVIHFADANAGNVYQETVFARAVAASATATSTAGQAADTVRCLGVRLFLHGTNLGILQESRPNVKQYDEATIRTLYKGMVGTLSVVQ